MAGFLLGLLIGMGLTLLGVGLYNHFDWLIFFGVISMLIPILALVTLSIEES